MPNYTTPKAVWAQAASSTCFTSAAAVNSIFATIQSAGFDTVFYSVNNSTPGLYTAQWASSIVPQSWNAAWLGVDPLGYAVSEAHRLGLKIQPWIWLNFDASSAFRTAHSTWTVKDPTLHADIVADSPPAGLHHFDFSQTDCRAWIVSIIDEILDGYDVDGIHLDCIRYWYDTSWDSSHRPYEYASIAHDDIDNMVSEAYTAVKAHSSSKLLTCAVNESMLASGGGDNAHQQTRNWLTGGYVDRVFTMCYHAPATAANVTTRCGQWKTLTNWSRITPGLSTKSNNDGADDLKTGEELTYQMDLARTAGFTDSVAIFESQHLTSGTPTIASTLTSYLATLTAGEVVSYGTSLGINLSAGTGLGSIRLYSYDKVNSLPHDLTGAMSGLRWSTSAPGGFRECTFKLRCNLLHQDSYVSKNDILRVRRGGETLWEGRIEDIGPEEGSQGRMLTVKALGFISSCHDQIKQISWTATASEDTPQDVIKYFLTNFCPDISSVVTKIVSTGVTGLNGVLTYKGQDNTKIFQEMTDVGWVSGGTYGDMNYAVWEGIQPPGTWAGALFTFEKRPTSPTYWVRMYEGEVKFQESLENYYNRVSVEYSGPTFSTVNDTVGQSALGRAGGTFIREMLVTQYASQTLSAGVSAQIANRYLTYHKQRRARGQSFTLRSNRLFGKFGQPVPLWKVRAGEIIRLLKLWPEAGTFAGTLNVQRDWYIVETEYDTESGTLTITPENALDRLDVQVARIARNAGIAL